MRHRLSSKYQKEYLELLVFLLVTLNAPYLPRSHHNCHIYKPAQLHSYHHHRGTLVNQIHILQLFQFRLSDHIERPSLHKDIDLSNSKGYATHNMCDSVYFYM